MNFILFDPGSVLLFYIVSCMAVLIFNILYVIADRFNKEADACVRPHIKNSIIRQMKLITSGRNEGRFRLYIFRKKLSSIFYMRIFLQGLKETEKECDHSEFKKYRDFLQKVFTDLLPSYKRKGYIEQSFFAYAAEKIGFSKDSDENSEITRFLIKSTGEKNVFLRENSLRALYVGGCVNHILLAFRRMEQTDNYYDSKLLSDGLLLFKGDREELAWVLWNHRAEFSMPLILPIMKFIRFLSGSFRREFYNVLKNKNEHKELRFEAIRYFRKYPFEPARYVLYEMLLAENTSQWEYAALSATALSTYPGNETTEHLKKMLYSSNWYVRLNSASALVNGLGVSPADLSDVYFGKHSDASDILEYAYQQAVLTGGEYA